MGHQTSARNQLLIETVLFDRHLPAEMSVSSIIEQHENNSMAVFRKVEFMSKMR